MEDKDYAETIFDYVNENNGFDQDFSLEDFKTTLKKDDNYVGTLYESLNTMDSTFKDELDLKTFKEQILDFKTEGGDEEEVTEKVEVEDKYKINTDIPKNEREVNEKYDPYLALLEDDKGNIIESQTVARDDDTGELLQGDALKEHIAKVKNDKLALIKLIGSELDEVSAAEALRNIAVKSLPTEQEINRFKWNTMERGHQGMMKSLLDKDGSIDLAIPTEANISKWKSESHEDLIKKWVRDWDRSYEGTKKGEEMLANPHMIEDWRIKQPEEIIVTLILVEKMG